MAAKKPVVKSDSTALALIKAEMLEDANALVKAEATAGGDVSSLGTRGGVLVYKDEKLKNNQISCVVVDYTMAKAFYPGIFDPENNAPPACYAFGKDDAKGMSPHPEAEEVPKGADLKPVQSCADCPMNVFGTSSTGRGKACSDTRRLALVLLDDVRSADDAKLANPILLKVPVTSVKAWSAYVKTLATVVGLPPYAVVTKISLTPDAKTQFQMNFETVEELTDVGVIRALRSKRDEFLAVLQEPFAKAQDKPAPGKKPAGAAKGNVAKEAPPAKKRKF